MVLSSRTVFFTIALAVTSIVGSSGLLCHQCTGEESTTFCNLAASHQRCGDGACVNSSENLPSCSDGIVETQCIWCCDGDLCNFDRFLYSPSTLPPTTTSTTTTTRPTTTTTTTTATPTTTTTTTTTSAVAFANSCNLKDFRSCLHTYRRNVVKTSLDPDRKFPEFCRDVTSVIQCLVDAVQDCTNSNPISQVLRPVLGLMENDCPKTCNTTNGLQCILKAQEHISNVLLTAGTACDVLKREAYICFECVGIFSSSCEEKVFQQYRATALTVEQAVNELCESGATTSPLSSPSAATAASVAVTSAHRRHHQRRSFYLHDSPESTSFPASEPFSLGCHIEASQRCISDLGAQIVRIRADGGAFDLVCSETLQQTEECAREQTSGCDAAVKGRVELALQYVHNLLQGACVVTTPAPVCDTTNARLCIFHLHQLVEGTDDFQRACDFVENTTRCVAEKTADCTLSEKVSLNRTLQQFPLKKIGNRCSDPVRCPVDQTITVEEGGEAKIVEFSFNFSPQTTCNNQECKLFVDFLPEQNSEPRCGNEKPITQFVIGAADKGQQLPYSTKEITSSNWNEVQRFTVAAKVDFKMDGNVTRELYIVTRKVVNGNTVERRTICVLKIVIIDRDRLNNRCQITGDPHITTFDRHSYNHYYEGVYTLYKHKTLPYQVQGVFQRCNPRASCTCALAVQAGDSVFVIDQCRTDTTRCHSNSFCAGKLKSMMYALGTVLPGFRIFSLGDGSQIVILTPHGMKVEVMTGKGYFNSVITPSPSDWGNINGLCGVYDGNTVNDLQFPDGTTYGARTHKFPKEFCESWRTPSEGIILKGVPRSSYVPPVYCESRPTNDVVDSSPFSACGSDFLLEMCEIPMHHEITLQLPREPTDRAGGNPYFPRDKRSAVQKSMLRDVYHIDISEDFDPENDSHDIQNDWTQRKAANFCDEYLFDREITRFCNQLPSFDAKPERFVCVEDILVTGNTSFALSALESMKHECMENALSNTTFISSDQGQQIIQNIKENNCINECSGNGRCEKGRCHCKESFAAEDCSIDKQAPIQSTEINRDGLCPTRLTDCTKIVVFGDSFINSASLTCLLTLAEITGGGFITHNNKTLEVAPVHISFNQIICPVPDTNTYIVQVSNDGQQYSEGHLFHPYDATCFNCAKDEHDRVLCDRKPESCVIDGACYAPGEENPEDDCKVCKPSGSTSEWTDRKDGECNNTMIIVVAVIVIVFVFAVVVVVAVFIFRRRRNYEGTSHQRHESGEVPESCHVSLGDTAMLTPSKKREETVTFRSHVNPLENEPDSTKL